MAASIFHGSLFIRLLALYFIACLIVCASAEVGVAQSDPLRNWADDRIAGYERISRILGGFDIQEPDYFGDAQINDRGKFSSGALVKHGKSVPTAGKGSSWYYDHIHGIAAGSFYGELRGDLLEYSPPPRLPIPDRDLSKVHSHLGLRLGLTAEQVVNILHIPIASVSSEKDGLRFLSVARQIRYKHGLGPVFGGLITFKNGFVVSIRLADAYG